MKNILIHEESYPLDPTSPAMAKRPVVLKAPSLRLLTVHLSKTVKYLQFIFLQKFTIIFSQYQITKKKQIHTDDGQTLIVEVEAKDAYGVYTDVSLSNDTAYQKLSKTVFENVYR